jgi:hypothetical protein
MRYSYAAEMEEPAAERMLRIGRLVDNCISRRLEESPARSINIDIGYVPIVMTDPYNRYPARTKLRIKQRKLDSAPKLDFHRFVNSSVLDAAKIYLAGLIEELPLIRRLGPTDDEYDCIIRLFEDVSLDVERTIQTAR